LFLAISVSLYDNHKRRESRISKKIRKRYYETAYSLMADSKRYGELETAKLMGEYGRRKLSSLEKRWLTDMLGNLRIDMDESCNMYNVHTILKALNLKEYFEHELQFSGITHKVRLLRFLILLEEEVPGSRIIPIQFSRYASVRKTAQYAYMLTENSDAFNYFTTPFFQKDFSLWDKVAIDFIMHRRKVSGKNLPDLAYFATSVKDPEAQSIFIAEAGFLNSNAPCKDFENIFRTSASPMIRSQVALTWGLLKYDAGEPMLVEAYRTQPESVKIDILRSLVMFNTHNEADFIAKAYYDAYSHNVRFAAANALYKYGENGLRLFNKLKDESDGNERLIFLEIENGVVNDENWEVATC
jgi:hypothetical protein